MNVLILGAAVSGAAAATLAVRLGHKVTVYDQKREGLEELPDEAAVTTGAWESALLGNIELVVTSPGLPEHADPIQDVLAAGIPLWSEMEFGTRHLGAPYAAVTGTNGKTTVTAAAADMLSASGLAAAAVGNIGSAVSAAAGSGLDAAVVEASSFQLRFVERFHPTAAAVLNVAPDHLDWHGDFTSYAAAKARIFENQTPGDLLVYNDDDPGALSLVATARSHRVPASGRNRPEGGNGPEAGRLVVDDMQFPLPALDEVFLIDLTVAATIARSMGATKPGIAAVLEAFEPGDHRRARVGTWEGVSWVDDSKATNPHAAAAAISAYPSVVLVAGGRNKGLDLAPMVSAPNLKAVVGIGEAGAELQQLVPPDRYRSAADIDDAVAIADAIATSGDTVLLAPGCASFDMFDSYAARGEQFAGAVLARKEGHNGQ